MAEYRCTRVDAYPIGTLGHADPAARQGHYVAAHSPAEAIAIMRRRFPGETFTAQYWGPDFGSARTLTA